MSFAKLDSGIVDSTIWCEPDDVLRVWIALLAKAGADGRVTLTAPALARLCGYGIERVREILALLESPDRDSRTEDNDGRRIERIPGGYLLLNHAKYRARRDDSIRAEQQRQWDREHRGDRPNAAARRTTSTPENPRQPPTTPDSPRPDPTQAEADTDTDKSKSTPRRRGRSPRLAMPEGFGISEGVRRWAVERGYNRLEQHLESFVIKAQKQGYVYADWDAAFKGAIRENWANLPATTTQPQAADVMEKHRAKKPADPSVAQAALRNIGKTLHGSRE